MNESAISVIQEFIDGCLPEPQIDWDKYYFEECSYSRWAAYEIQKRIIDELSRLPPHITGREPILPDDVISNFICEMDDFAYMKEGTPQERIFSIARDVGIDILSYYDWEEINYG